MNKLIANWNCNNVRKRRRGKLNDNWGKILGPLYTICLGVRGCNLNYVVARATCFPRVCSMRAPCRHSMQPIISWWHPTASVISNKLIHGRQLSSLAVREPELG